MSSSKSDGNEQELQELKTLKNALLGDQFAKWNLMVTQRDVVNKVVTVALGGTQSVKDALDVLLSLLNLGEDAKLGLGSVYCETVASIFKRLTISAQEPPLITLKKSRLANMCAGDYNAISLMPGLHACLLQYVKEHCNGRVSKYHSEVIVELLSCCLKNTEELQPALHSASQQLLLHASTKYISCVEFRYLLKREIKNEQAPNFQDYDPLSNTGLNNISESFQTCPDAVEVDDPLDRSLIPLSVNIYLKTINTINTFSGSAEDTSRVKSLWDSEPFVLFLSSLLKSGHIELKCCAMKFFTYCYIGKGSLNEKQLPLQLLLPHLVESFNYDNIPWWFDPFEILTQLVEYYNENNPLNNPVSNFLYGTKLTNGIIQLLAKYLSLSQQTSDTVVVVHKLIKLCASLTSYDEKTRKLLLVDKAILHHAEAGLESHLKLVSDFLEHKNNHINSLKGVSLPPFYDSDITLSWVLLLKSFSRSVTALRTFLKRNQLAGLLLGLVKKIFQLAQNYDFAGEQLLGAEVQILGAALGVLSNFVVEFSNLQSFVIENGVMEIVGLILKDPFFNDNATPEFNACRRPSSVSASMVQTNALWVLRHLMYNSHNEDKLDLLSIIPMDVILQFVNSENWLVQEQCFQLLRNLTCNSRRVVNILLENFSDTEQSYHTKYTFGSTYLFEFLAHKIKMLDAGDSKQRKTLEGILYIIVNITAINENKRQLVIQQDELLQLIKAILAESDEAGQVSPAKTDIQIASLWILTNLIWASTTSNAHMLVSEPHPVTHMEDAGPATSSDTEGANGRKSRSQESDEVYDDEVSDAYQEDDANQDDENDDLAFTDDPGIPDSFVRPKSLRTPTKLKISATERCSKLVRMGFYDIVKLKTLDTQLRIREQAKLLLFHMDLLRKGM